jgi:hypothetical protein
MLPPSARIRLLSKAISLAHCQRLSSISTATGSNCSITSVPRTPGLYWVMETSSALTNKSLVSNQRNRGVRSDSAGECEDLSVIRA